MQRCLLGLLFVFYLILGPFNGSIAAEAIADSIPPKSVTSANRTIPVYELELLLRPLTKSELLVEAKFWQVLVQSKAEKISRMLIVAKRLQKEIKKTEDIKKKEEIVTLQGKLAELRIDRTMLLENFEAVIAALNIKTDENDAETLARVRDYILYASAVSGIDIDGKESTQTRLAIKNWLVSGEGGYRWGLNILKFIGILIVTWVISRAFSTLIQHAMKLVSGTSRLLKDFLVQATRWAVISIGVVMALAALGISTAPLLAVVGAVSFAIAFALRDSLSNFANGLMIMFFKPFDVGHIVDTAGVSGLVQSVNLVSTSIKTFDNRLIVVPNNKVWNDVITNASALEERRVDMEFSIGYKDDIDKAQTVLEEIVASHPDVLEEPAPKICVNALGESSIDFIVRPWVKRANRLNVYWDITREVKKRFDAEGIGIPYPQRDVHLYHKETNRKAEFKQSPSDRTAGAKNSDREFADS